MKTRLVRLMMLVGLVALTACGSEASRIEQLRKDLMLANSAYPYQPYMTPLEQGYGYAPRYQQPYANGGYTPVNARSTPVVRREPVYASTTTRAPVATRVVKNTKRDAIIGAVAGGALGAVITRDVKGAVIGAAAGGILGAVIGNNVDKKRVPIP